jgi:hypothetical protein
VHVTTKDAMFYINGLLVFFFFFHKAASVFFTNAACCDTSVDS